MLPTSSHLDSKICQDSPTCGQDRPKYSPRVSNKTPRLQNIAKTMYCRSIFDFRHFLKYHSQDQQKCWRCLPKWPQVCLLGPNLEPLGVILVPTWLHLGPFGRNFGRSESGQNWPKSAKTDFERFFVSRSLPRAPRPSPDLDFLRFWDLS